MGVAENDDNPFNAFFDSEGFALAWGENPDVCHRFSALASFYVGWGQDNDICEGDGVAVVDVEGLWRSLSSSQDECRGECWPYLRPWPDSSLA